MPVILEGWVETNVGTYIQPINQPPAVYLRCLYFKDFDCEVYLTGEDVWSFYDPTYTELKFEVYEWFMWKRGDVREE